MRKTLVVLTISVFLACSSSYLWAQRLSEDKVALTGTSKFSSYSLLDPERMDLHHSYSLSYFSSNQGSFSLGIYTTILDYRISSPLRLRLGFSYLHQPLGVLGNRGNLNIKHPILPSFQLRYQPNEKTLFLINFSTLTNPYIFQTE